LYSSTIEKNKGIPAAVKQLLEKLKKVDGFLLASPEHNGLMPAALKNLMDWLSRADGKYLNGLTTMLLSTSPGGFGGANNLKVMSRLIVYTGAELVGTYSLPSFFDNFDVAKGVIKNEEEQIKMSAALKNFEKVITTPVEA
jgi:NAD(P)H-dependent FMN reductase